MGSLVKMLAFHCILLIIVLLSTPVTANGNNGLPTSSNPANQVAQGSTTTMESAAEPTTFFEFSADEPSITESFQPQDTSSVKITSTEAVVETSSTETLTVTDKTTQSRPPNTVSTTVSEKTTQNIPTSTVSTVKSHETPSSTTKSETSAHTTKIEKSSSTANPVNPGGITKPSDALTVKGSVSSETSSIKGSSSTKDLSTDSNFLGVDKNSFTAKVILPIAAGIILAVFIVLIVCSIRSCLDRKDRNSSRRRTMDHDMAPMDRVMLLADSSEDEF